MNLNPYGIDRGSGGTESNDRGQRPHPLFKRPQGLRVNLAEVILLNGSVVSGRHAAESDKAVTGPGANPPRIMGILNLTPDSFSDGGRYRGVEEGLRQAERMLAAGADIIDVGGESTRPGAEPVAAEEEIRRTAPVVEAVVRELDARVSIDTSKAPVARAALDAGAVMVNDVTGLRGDAAMAPLVRERGVEVVIMHMQGTPRTMQKNPTYGDVVADIRAFFAERLAFCRGQGIDAGKVILDPGIGFGKTLEHNLAILANIPAFKSLGRPVLIGHSRKSFLGALLGLEVEERDCATAMVSCLAALDGADYLRVHEVGLTRQACALAAAVAGRRQETGDRRQT